jgi:hypothetical protein
MAQLQRRGAAETRGDGSRAASVHGDAGQSEPSAGDLQMCSWIFLRIKIFSSSIK